ncbi:hypothetical protein BDA96_04G333300 [Sorghum bicolor]|uniref:Uncharacterized protein n=1 Tax=Sorghum bicolor TaxID=4558 RepID=A0A921R826_SORBI|nr:hypothetical protein BDA96_04G333300 [Sorghum bicolor]
MLIRSPSQFITASCSARSLVMGVCGECWLARGIRVLACRSFCLLPERSRGVGPGFIPRKPVHPWYYPGS